MFSGDATLLVLKCGAEIKNDGATWKINGPQGWKTIHADIDDLLNRGLVASGENNRLSLTPEGAQTLEHQAAKTKARGMAMLLNRR